MKARFDTTKSQNIYEAIFISTILGFILCMFDFENYINCFWSFYINTCELHYTLITIFFKSNCKKTKMILAILTLYSLDVSSWKPLRSNCYFHSKSADLLQSVGKPDFVPHDKLYKCLFPYILTSVTRYISNIWKNTISIQIQMHTIIIGSSTTEQVL